MGARLRSLVVLLLLADHRRRGKIYPFIYMYNIYIYIYIYICICKCICICVCMYTYIHTAQVYVCANFSGNIWCSVGTVKKFTENLHIQYQSIWCSVGTVFVTSETYNL